MRVRACVCACERAHANCQKVCELYAVAFARNSNAHHDDRSAGAVPGKVDVCVVYAIECIVMVSHICVSNVRVNACKLNLHMLNGIRIYSSRFSVVPPGPY